jgi:predicted transposase YdaD
VTDDNPIPNPHDALFRGVFADPQRAAELLRGVLGEALAGTDWSSLERIDASFVDEELRDHQADLLFRAKVRGRTCYFYILFEHKSGVYRFAVFQLLRYVVRIWEQCRADDPAAKHLPLVLPVLVHIGDGPWTSPSSLTELLDAEGAPKELLAMQPTFRCTLFDLGATDEDGLRRRRFTVQTLLPLLHLQQLRRQVATAALLLAWRPLLLRLMQVPGGQQIMNKLYSYVATVSKDDPRHLRAAYARISKTCEEQYMTVAEKLIEEGRQQGLQQGLQQGRQEGRQEGAQRTLLMQIEQRFGALQPSVVQRIENASQGEIDRWLRRILTAATLDDLLT